MVDHVLLMAVAPPLILLGARSDRWCTDYRSGFVREALAGFLCWSPGSGWVAFLDIRFFVGLPPQSSLS